MRWRIAMTRVYFTKNTEYHVHQAICVRVLRREDGRRLSDHAAIGARLLGGIRFPTNDSVMSSIQALANRGDVLVFIGAEEMVMSTTIEKTELRDDAGVVIEENGEEVATWRKRRA